MVKIHWEVKVANMVENLANIQIRAEHIAKSGIVREGYEGAFVEVIKRWEYINSVEMADYMLSVVEEYCRRVSNKVSTYRLATFLIAKAKSVSNSMNTENAAQLLEVVGIMIKGGNSVVEKIQNEFNDIQIESMTMCILKLYNNLYKLRQQNGAGSAAEINCMLNAFNLQNSAFVSAT